MIDIDSDGVIDGDDCDDNNASINPGEIETWYDGVDQDCLEDNDYDADKDGYESEAYDADGDGEYGLDCDDTTTDTGPEAPEINGDGIDNNCNGDTDAFDFDLEWGEVHEHGETWDLTLTIDDMPLVDPETSLGELYYWADNNGYVYSNVGCLGMDLYANLGGRGWFTVEYGGNSMTAEISEIGAWSSCGPPEVEDPEEAGMNYMIMLYSAPDFDDTLASGFTCYTKESNGGVDWTTLTMPTGVAHTDCTAL